MTSNYPGLLDPALIRPGRIDLQLELGYTTRYQLENMYARVVGTNEGAPDIDRNWLSRFPERVLPPCDCMRILIAHRHQPQSLYAALDRMADLELARAAQDDCNAKDIVSLQKERELMMQMIALLEGELQKHRSTRSHSWDFDDDGCGNEFD
ncbi:hypothetical protein THASP1DRAFT_31144 [Thamnocephalis sphaerospora]|uniref:ATPase AAA-type core domain-containing protein n=1 Tax=Thamnocephalis sphaerospora TaxID=78915 RepID=A0A4P9XMD1_9FUNG|nr:hypothetical protein THASP1DRAFT_31144 [Thamnocephalis sphaerospora]|eukprot:RKP07035.1 hypothetical protein THASP1DRAFT_31144 [Thamnocephalis sphaerospora]